MNITHTDIDKNRLYASLGVPEFWRLNVEIWCNYCLVGYEYKETETSPTFSFIQKEDLYRFLAAAKQDEVEAEINVRNLLNSQR